MYLYMNADQKILEVLAELAGREMAKGFDPEQLDALERAEGLLIVYKECVTQLKQKAETEAEERAEEVKKLAEEAANLLSDNQPDNNNQTDE